MGHVSMIGFAVPPEWVLVQMRTGLPRAHRVTEWPKRGCFVSEIANIGVGDQFLQF